VIIIKIDIVGGSIAGLNTALSIKKYNKNIKVVVHEKHKIIGFNHEGRRCGEVHSMKWGWSKGKPNEKSIYNEIKKVETNIGNKKYVSYLKLGVSSMLNRQEFISQMGKEAEKNGIEIYTNDKVKSLNDLDGDYIVDASGCPSSIKRELKIKHGLANLTYQQTIEDCNWFKSDTIRTFFTGISGYFWAFPRNPEKKEVNLGVGTALKENINLKQMLEQFKKDNNITGKVNYVLGGMVPTGLQRPFSYKNILFVGDAGVGAFPLTGEGIHRALISSDIAGECIANGYPKKYPHRIMQEFIKWELIGKTFLGINYILTKIGPKILLSSIDYFTRFNFFVVKSGDYETKEHND